MNLFNIFVGITLIIFIKFISDETISSGKSKLKNTIDSGREWIYKFVIVTLTTSVLIFTSVFMYGSFYFAFIPVVEHEVI